VTANAHQASRFSLVVIWLFSIATLLHATRAGVLHGSSRPFKTLKTLNQVALTGVKSPGDRGRSVGSHPSPMIKHEPSSRVSNRCADPRNGPVTAPRASIRTPRIPSKCLSSHQTHHPLHRSLLSYSYTRWSTLLAQFLSARPSRCRKSTSRP
jgi:hypothetical protein